MCPWLICESLLVQCSNIFTQENLEVEEWERAWGREGHAPGQEMDIDVPPCGHRLPTPALLLLGRGLSKEPSPHPHP